MSKKLILLIGAPGSGKTTDAKTIAKNHPEITSYSVGELVGEEIEKHTTLGKICNDYVSKGELVPTAITIDTMCEAVRNAPTQIVMIDGFPRKEKQMKVFGDMIRDPKRSDLVAVIEIRVREEVARERVLGKEGTATNEQEEIFNNQMSIYKETIAQIEEFYNENHLLKVIDGEREANAVIEDIDAFLNEHKELHLS